jgi:hypothetical protein
MLLLKIKGAIRLSLWALAIYKIFGIYQPDIYIQNSYDLSKIREGL